MTIPGSISASSIQHVVEAHAGLTNMQMWSSSPAYLPPMSEDGEENAQTPKNEINILPPLVYYFGATDPNENWTLYKELVDKLAGNVVKKLEFDPLCKFIDLNFS